MAADYRFCPQCAATLSWIEQIEDSGPKSRLRCAACGFTHWNNPTPVLAAVVECTDRGGRLLLARNAAWSGRMFALITGFMEAGETPEEGIAREVAEETALVADAVKLIGVYDFQRLNQVIIAYHVQARGEISLRPNWRSTACSSPATPCAGPPARAMRWPTGCGAAASSLASSIGRAATTRPPHPPLHRVDSMEAHKEIDTRGLNCPLPILKAKKALADMASGQVLKVVATDPGSMRDFQAFARQTGNELLEQQTQDAEFIHYLRRR